MEVLGSSFSIRNLYARISKNVFVAMSLQTYLILKRNFLGWKVQLLKDFSKSEDLESPFWDISSDRVKRSREKDAAIRFDFSR